MHTYLINFTIYTLAMLGIIFIAFIIAKKSLSLGGIPGHKTNSLAIENRLSLEPRKNLYIIKAGEERFLISTDGEGSRFLTKLQQNDIDVYKEENGNNSEEFNFKKNIAMSNVTSNSSVMRRMLKKLNSETISE
jgi:flagellar biogenesis protein FliO